MWSDKRYHTFDYEMKKVFGEKAIKLSLDGGFTCPNRDGKIGERGCIFCSERGSGDFTSMRSMSITDQINEQKNIMSQKWSSNSYIAYFQNYTNTYDTVDNLGRKFDEALHSPCIRGLAISTRPDCIDDDIAMLISGLNTKTYLWIELGLQTIHKDTSDFIRTGYDIDVFNKTVSLLKKYNIKLVIHLIMGLPNENKDNMLDTIKYISYLKPWGVKLHLLHVIKNTDLEKYFFKTGFNLLSQEEYVNIICDSLEILPPETVIHRLTGDGKKSDLIAPLWSLNKLKVLSDIDKEMKNRNSMQGCKLLL